MGFISDVLIIINFNFLFVLDNIVYLFIFMNLLLLGVYIGIEIIIYWFIIILICIINNSNWIYLSWGELLHRFVIIYFIILLFYILVNLLFYFYKLEQSYFLLNWFNFFILLLIGGTWWGINIFNQAFWWNNKDFIEINLIIQLFIIIILLHVKIIKLCYNLDILFQIFIFYFLCIEVLIFKDLEIHGVFYYYFIFFIIIFLFFKGFTFYFYTKLCLNRITNNFLNMSRLGMIEVFFCSLWFIFYCFLGKNLNYFLYTAWGGEDQIFNSWLLLYLSKEFIFIPFFLIIVVCLFINIYFFNWIYFMLKRKQEDNKLHSLLFFYLNIVVVLIILNFLFLNGLSLCLGRICILLIILILVQVLA